MKKYTGTVILGCIALVFGVDTILSLGENATISEWFYNFLHNDPLIGFTTLVGAFTALIAHFWWFRPKD
jgi:fumarate reductase subunit C